MINVNKNVSYSKQIARQHSWSTVKISFISSLIIIRNLVVVSYTVCAHVGNPNIWRRCDPLCRGRGRPSETRYSLASFTAANFIAVGQTVLIGLYWTGLTLLNGFSFLVIFFLFLFWVVR